MFGSVRSDPQRDEALRPERAEVREVVEAEGDADVDPVARRVLDAGADERLGRSGLAGAGEPVARAVDRLVDAGAPDDRQLRRLLVIDVAAELEEQVGL